MKWFVVPFDKLSPDDLYDLLELRTNVFVVEQNCPYPELDRKDQKAIHVFARDQNGEIVAVARIFEPGISYSEASIGRVCTSSAVRGSGAGIALMELCIREIEQRYGKCAIRISAQEYLKKFYSSFGFVQVSETYLEDDIPHIAMLRAE